MGSNLVGIHNVAVLVMFLSTVTKGAHPWIGTGDSLNRRDTRSLLDISGHSSEPRSLVFVFDVTSSMKDDWKGAMSGSQRILSELLSYDVRPVKNFILVPFNDPVVGPVKITEDSDEFLTAIKSLRIRNGGDCPEMAIEGIIEALKAAHPYSYIYVFTDASAKDYNRFDEALKLIERKHSQVIFFITGDCEAHHKEEFLVYEKIASASYGQLYYILKKNIDDVLNSVLITTKPNKSNLLVVSNPKLDSNNSTKYHITVEEDLKQLIFEVAGASPDVDIRNPLGNKPDNINVPFDLPNNKFITIDHPEPAGNWVLKVTFHPEKVPNNPVDIPLITVKGVGSSFAIKQGFSIIPVDTLSGTAYRPLEKRENYIYMEVNPTEDTKENKEKLAKFKWENVDVMKTNGEPFFSLSLEQKVPQNGKSIFPMRYLAGPFTPPDSLFSLSFRGLDENGNPVTRLSSNYISAEQSSAPYVKMTSLEEFVIGKELKITCEVESLIPFSLQWYKDGKPIGAKKDFLQSSGDSLVMANSKKEDKGLYKCEATNFRGSDSKDTVVSGLALPEIKGMDEGKIVAAEGDSINLKCEVVSDSPYDVNWLLKKTGMKEGALLSPSDAVMIQSDSISLPSLKPSDVGKYVCRASNKAGTVEKEVEIVMIAPPTIEIPKEKLFMFVKGENILIDCKVSTIAKTAVHWEFNGVEVGTRKDILTNDSIQLSIPSANNAWEGIYTCVAENDAEKVQKQVESIYVEFPSVKAVTPYVATKLNEDVMLQCIVSGIPPPVTSWVLRNKILTSSAKYQMSADGSTLKILEANLNDEGIYKCVAHGPRNSESSAEIKLRIGRPPTAKHLVLNSSIELYHDGTFPCESEFNPEDASYPGMRTKISWQRERGSLDSIRHLTLTSGELKIKAADVTDKGLYICKLQNAFGETIMRLNLEVKGIKPPIIKNLKPAIKKFKKGDTIELFCDAGGRPEPKIRWSFGSSKTSMEEIPEEYAKIENEIMIEGRKLTLYNAIAAYEGIFSCVGDNGVDVTPPKYFTLRMKRG